VDILILNHVSKFGKLQRTLIYSLITG
jgi:hypothetical protein